jgi:hypothetical protein
MAVEFCRMFKFAFPQTKSPEETGTRRYQLLPSAVTNQKLLLLPELAVNSAHNRPLRYCVSI